MSNADDSEASFNVASAPAGASSEVRLPRPSAAAAMSGANVNGMQPTGKWEPGVDKPGIVPRTAALHVKRTVTANCLFHVERAA
jgi:hypothetical protein